MMDYSLNTLIKQYMARSYYLGASIHFVRGQINGVHLRPLFFATRKLAAIEKSANLQLHPYVFSGYPSEQSPS